LKINPKVRQPMKKNIHKIIKILIAFLLLVSLTPQHNIFAEDTQPKSEEYVFRRSWGGEGNQILDPHDVVVGEDGKLFIANMGLNRITIFDMVLRTNKEIGEIGSEDGQFDMPMSIAVNSYGEIFVADSWNHRIQKFNKEGDHLLTWDIGGGLGSAKAITLDQNENIFVVDCSVDKIRKYSSNGVLMYEWGSSGSEEGQFDCLYDIAVDKNGYIYVTDSGNYRVQKFSQSYDFVKSWSTIDYQTSTWFKPYGIATDENNRVFISGSNERVIITSESGTFITSFGGEGEGDGEFRWANGIDVDKNGNIYVADVRSNRVQKFTSNGIFITSYGSPELSSGMFYSPNGIAVNDKHVYVTQIYYVSRIQKFDLFGSFIKLWGLYEPVNYQFDDPQLVSLDPNGNVFIVEKNNHLVKKFNSEGTYLLTWGTLGSELGQFESPVGITINDSGQVYVADTGNNRIQKFTNNGGYLGSWGTEGSNPGQFNSPTALDLDSAGNIIVLDQGNERIQIFNTEGTYLSSWTIVDPLLGFGGYSDIAVDKNNNIYLMKYWESRILKFSYPGEYISEFGSFGSVPAQFLYSQSFTIDDNDYLYVSDRGNNRIQVFSPGLPKPDAYSGLTLNGTFESTLVLSEWTYGGPLPVSRSTNASQGTYSLQLAQPVTQSAQGEGQAWAHQTFYVRPEWDRPMLSFKYNMYVNDIMDYSDFFVAIQDGVGLNHLATVVRDGYQPCIPGTAPAAGTNLGWRSVTYDLSAYKGQHIRLVFSNRNLWPISWGIWTYVDDVKVVDAGPLPPPAGPERLYIPLVNKITCDPVMKSSVKGYEDGLDFSRPSVTH